MINKSLELLKKNNHDKSLLKEFSTLKKDNLLDIS